MHRAIAQSVMTKWFVTCIISTRMEEVALGPSWLPAPCLCVNGVETTVGARAPTNRWGNAWRNDDFWIPSLVWSCVLHVAFLTGCGSWLQAVKAIAGTGVVGWGGLRSRRRALTSFVEPEERKQLHEGRISGIRCQHFQMMITRSCCALERRQEGIVSGTGAKKTHDFHCQCGHQGRFCCGWARSVQENYSVTRPHMGGSQLLCHVKWDA